MCAAGLAATVPASAGAAASLYLTWDDCALGANAVSNFVFACGSNDGFEELFAAFTVPQATGADVLGIVAVIDVQHSSPTLPAWWRLEESGGCRSQCATARCLAASTDFSLVNACVNPWPGSEVSEIQGFAVGEPRGGANQVRIKVATGVNPVAAVSLNDTDTYYAFKLVIQNTWTSGALVCAGCSGSACLVLNSIEVIRTPGAPGGDLFLQTPGLGNLNWARWQGSSDADCGMVPVRRTTWGLVKSLYR